MDASDSSTCTNGRIRQWWKQGHGLDHIVRRLGLPVGPGLARVAAALDRMPEASDEPPGSPQTRDLTGKALRALARIQKAYEALRDVVIG